MINLLPLVASGHPFTSVIRVVLFILFVFFIGLLVMETFSFIRLFHVDLLVKPVRLAE